MRRHENTKKKNNIYFFSLSRLPFPFSVIYDVNAKRKKNTFWNFPPRCMCVLYSWPHGGRIGQSIRPLNWIQVLFISPYLRKIIIIKKNLSNCLADAQGVPEKKNWIAAIFIHRQVRMCWSWANNIPLLVPDRYVKKKIKLERGLLSAPLFMPLPRQKHQGKHYFAKTVKDDTRLVWVLHRYMDTRFP